ncbi:tRNA 2-selenouridine(34) synthase MnmH [Rhodoferax aquaticus]|uniref:tRNA 2-selenouridine(34) synthase MnmH n=1 Tax=Rhodoferax aquaticus TaxID=2527691 RepID=A0A515EPX9_9BURK|nr:tRNA 2-selenouridine(34) synthase MnmH [Rhodoferax aquaticus]QDL54717.1 tRNA 2-selenouridine(34) synthase MnmH [Rhodoferax aquaticus]
MSVSTITASELLVRLHEFDTVIDARTEDEYALDHLPGAVNWPTLSNQERITIGTMYVQVSQFEAKKRGAAMAARNIAAHIEREVMDKPRDWKPLAYCWRGGKRSGSLALILGQIGFRVTMVDGGYKAFRAAVVAATPSLVRPLQWRVICGTTGSGKTRLLHALAAQGAQVLDLEALAKHRSSVLGAIPGVSQPSQKRFDTLVWSALRTFDPSKPVYVESESKKVGNVAVPMCLIEAMRASPCINLELPQAQRVALLLEDYDYFVNNTEHFCSRLQVLAEIRGKATVQQWIAQVRAGDIVNVVTELLALHYDPVYHQSMRRNFSQFDRASICTLKSREPHDLAESAKALLQAS